MSSLSSCRVEVLCHDINVHVPHHVSPKIPWYNLRKATDSLRDNWGEVSPIQHDNYGSISTDRRLVENILRKCTILSVDFQGSTYVWLLQYMTEARWNWRMMKVIFTELHFYDSESNYRPFDFMKEEKFLALQRKLLPNTFKA